MNDKQTCINIFNNIIRGHPVDFEKTLFPFVINYLTDINCNKLQEKINLLSQHPELIQKLVPEIMDYYSKKYNLLSIIFNHQIILYYE